MKHYIGMDVSLKEVSICVIDAEGVIAAEGKVATEPALIVSWVEERIGAVDRIVHESGPLSIWLTRELTSLGAPVVCIDARAAHKALSARMNKSDRADAEALAQLPSVIRRAFPGRGEPLAVAIALCGGSPANVAHWRLGRRS